jgi:uncharacterized protein
MFIVQCTRERLMKLQPDKSDVQIINAYGAGWVSVGSMVAGVPKLEKVTHSIVIGSHGERLDWPSVGFAQLSADLFDQLAQIKPELVIFGSGRTLRFPSPALQRTLMAARIGLETMDTLAACRTYNILAGEDRHVLAVLLIDPTEIGN